MTATLNYIDADHGVAGSVTIDEELFFPAPKNRLESLRTILGMSRSEEELRDFLDTLKGGIVVAQRINRIQHGQLLFKLESGHIGEKAAAKEMQRIEKEERLLISNEEVIDEWRRQYLRK